MRPRRAAALAANAAITAQSNQKNDEEPVLVDDEGSCSNEDASIEGDGTIVEQQPPSLLTFKRKKKMPMTCTSTTTTTAAVEDDKKSKGKVQVNRDEEEEDKDVGASNNNNGNSTFMFHKLPTELRGMILGYLEYDPYTILSLTLVSKHFLSNLGINSNEPEKDWERRCKLLEGGRNKKSPGYKTWRETYIQIIKKKCAICHKNTKAKLGKLYDNNINGPKIIVVCEPCQQIQDTPYSVISTKAIDIVIKEYPIPWLKGITFKMRKINDQFWLKEHLFNTVVKIYANELIKTSLEVNGLNEVNEEKKEITLQIAREIATKILKRAMEIYRLETGPIAF